MQKVVNEYPYNAYKSPNIHETKFVNRKLGTIVDPRNTTKDGLNYGYPYIYKKEPFTKQYPVEPTSKDGKYETPTTARRLYDDSYKISEVVIDSRDRSKLPQIVLQSLSQPLSADPLSFTAQSNIMTVNFPNHGLSASDLVAINNVSFSSFILNNPFSTVVAKNVVKIAFPGVGHGLTNNYTAAQNLFIQISNVSQSVDVYQSNLLNGIHKLFLTSSFDAYLDETTFTTTFDTNSLYITLPFSAKTTVSNVGGNSIQIDLMFVSGVPIFYINNGTPATTEHVYAYHTVNSIIDANNFTIRLAQPAIETISSGGNCVTVSTISDVADGFATASQYVYNLKKSYKNVIQVKLISTEFPNVETVIKKDVNDKVYWQDLDDINPTTYNAVIPPGSYLADSLQQILETQMNAVIRNKVSTTDPDEQHLFSVSINPQNNIVSFSSFRTKFLNNSIFIRYQIAQSGVTQVLVRAELYVIDASHLLVKGDKVLILFAPNYDIVPSSIITGEHIVSDVNNFSDVDNTTSHRVNGVLDPPPFGPTVYDIQTCMQLLGFTSPYPNFYKIVLPIFTPLPVVGNTPAGFSPFMSLPTMNTTFICNSSTALTVVVTPNSFRMLFNQPDTVGPILGFRNCGEFNSVTSFLTTVKNTDMYDAEKIVPPIATNTNQIAINLSGENYMYMCSNILSSNSSIEGKIPNVFAKILLNNNPGYTLFQSFVNMPSDFVEPLKELTSIDLTFIDYDGSLYDFKGLEHSFTLQIVELLTRPLDINVSSRQGNASIKYFTSLTPLQHTTIT